MGNNFKLINDIQWILSHLIIERTTDNDFERIFLMTEAHNLYTGHACNTCKPHPVLAQKVERKTIQEGPRERSVGSKTPSVTEKADLLVVGKVVTMDPAHPEAGAMAVADGRVMAIGSRNELEGLKGPGTEMLELGDRVVLPGLIEPHMHLWTTVIFDAWLDCSPMTHPTFDSIVDVLRQAADKAAPGEWIRGELFDPSLLPGEPDLTADILDKIAPDKPVVVMNASMHFAYANSKAFEMAGITADTPDPEGGVFFRSDGRLTGVVSEIPAMMMLMKPMPVMTHDELVAGLKAIMSRASAAGVTKIHEAATGGLLGPSEFDLLHALGAGGALPVRITTAQLDMARAAWETSGLQPGAGDDDVRAVSWKLVSDGSNQGRTGYLREPYIGGDGGRGKADCTSDEIIDAIQYANKHGWQMMVHANGDAAIDMTVAAYEKALAGTKPNGLRHRIEHCSLADDASFERMAAVGVSPSFLLAHVYYWGEVFRDDIFGHKRAEKLDKVASARHAGLRPTFHSDHSVSPIEPLRLVQTAVTRRMRTGGDILNVAQRDAVADALRAVTIDAAWQTHTDDVIGSLEVGKYADMVILSGDPHTVDVEGIADLKVLETRLAGAIRPQA